MKKLISIAFFSFCIVCFLASGVVFSSSPVNILEENTPSETQSQSDTLQLPRTLSPLEKKLKDPDYDVRMPGGTRLQPWHDVNSMYPRRTLQISQMA